jgi:CRISPR-associated protein Csm1
MITQQPKFPIYQMARIAGNAESSAKGNTSKCQEEKCHKDWSKCSLRDSSGECGRKNSIALLYDAAISGEAVEIKKKIEEQRKYKFEEPAERIKVALTWDKADKYILEIVKLLKETGKNKVTHIKPDALPRGFIYKVFEVINIWRGQGLLYLPAFAWILRQIQNNLKRRKGTDFANEFVIKFYTFDSERISSMHIPMSWFDLLTRGGSENEPTL